MTSVSIVIPVYNQRPSYLASTIESARAQTDPAEIVIVDDCSSEPVPGATVTHEKNRGIAAALNSGIQAMTGGWFCWLSSDDLLSPVKVANQLAAVTSRGYKVSYHRYYTSTREDGTPEAVSIDHRVETQKHQRQRLASGCVINGSTVMIHRSVFDDVGLFDESYRYAQDWDMWCRIAKKYPWLYLPEILGTRRNAGNLTERIAADPALNAVLAEENARVKTAHGDWWT